MGGSRYAFLQPRENLVRVYTELWPCVIAARALARSQTVGKPCREDVQGSPGVSRAQAPSLQGLVQVFRVYLALRSVMSEMK